MNTLITLITLIKLMKITQLLAAAGAPTCSIKNSTNCFHDDIPDYKFIIVNRTEQCCDACSSTPDCAAWTVDRSNYSPGLEEGGDCYLKTACTTLGPFNYGESGVMDEATWPETPFPPSWWNLSPLPKTKVGKKKVITYGHSSGGDMAIQMHVAFSDSIGGVCGFDAQPYHCAATMFPRDNLVPQTDESSVPYCYGCPPDYTLVYDHCKSHPEWVDVGLLPDYPRRVCGEAGLSGCMSNVDALKDTSVYLQRSECNTYVEGAEENAFAMYATMTDEPDKQIEFLDTCKNSITNDTQFMCLDQVLSHVQGHGLVEPRDVDEAPAGEWQRFDQTMYLDDFNAGFDDAGWVYVPKQCLGGGDGNDGFCSMMVWFHGCGGNHNKVAGKPPGTDDVTVRYADTNNVVLLQPAILRDDKLHGFYNNVTETYTNSMEIERGCWDGYGQLGSDYALQSGAHNRNIWNMIAELSGDDYEVKQSEECVAACTG